MPRPTRRITPTRADGRPVKITLGEMREMGVRRVLVYCCCGHHMALSADRWPNDLRLSDVEPRLVCTACGRRGAELRPDFETGKPPLAAMDCAGPAPPIAQPAGGIAGDGFRKSPAHPAR
ncbi:hypothetical protein [Bradyrhizobium guangxiense]|uniref:hypothetical protein n=1 Tax=Bradyrhizobium guangxiense TaxID=1325115 RepID=UPI003221B97F